MFERKFLLLKTTIVFNHIRTLRQLLLDFLQNSLGIISRSFLERSYQIWFNHNLSGLQRKKIVLRRNISTVCSKLQITSPEEIVVKHKFFLKSYPDIQWTKKIAKQKERFIQDARVAFHVSRGSIRKCF